MAEKVSVIYEFTMDTAEAVRNIENAKQKINELRNAEKELNDERDEGNITTEEYTQKLAELRIAQEQQKIVVKSNTDVLKANAKQMATNKGSLEAMRGELKKLQVEYDNLSEAERKSAKGEELQHKLEVLNNDIKGVEMSTGRFGRNVGNYLNSIKSAMADMGGATGNAVGAIDKLGLGIKTIVKIPIVAVINVLIGALIKIFSAVKKNEQAWDAIKSSMVGFKAIGIVVQKTLNGLAKGVASVVGWLGKFIDKLNIGNDKINEAKKQAKEINELEKSIRDGEREWSEERAMLEQKNAEIHLKVVDEEKYNAIQRRKYLLENIDIQKQIYDGEVERLKERMRLNELRIKTEGRTTELLDEQSALRVELTNKETEMIEKMDTYTSELQGINREVAELAKTQGEAVEEIKVITEEMPSLTQSIMDNLSGIATANGDAMDEYVQKVKDANDEVLELWHQQIDEETKLAQEQVQIQQNKALAIGSIFGSLSALSAKFGEKNESLARASKVLAIAQVAIEGGVAIARATADGAKLGIPGIIATVATATTNLALAIASIASAKFATGGYVKGAGSGTSDSIPARLSNGESVINAKSTKMYYPLLSAINQAGGGVAFGNEGGGNKFAFGGVIGYDAINNGRNSAELSQIVEEIKNIHPYVVVSDIKKGLNRLNVKENRL